ncbi:MAG: porin family protein [Bacteroidota bacterium]
MPDTSLELLIKRKLEALQLPYRPSDWIDMETRLDQAFDAHVRELLTHYTFPLAPEAWKDFLSHIQDRWDADIEKLLSTHEVTYTPESWASLKADLDGQTWEVLLIQKLQALDLPLDLQSWQALEQLLDQYSEDSLLRNKLARHELSFEAADWDSFEQFRNETFDHTLKEKLTSLDMMEGPAWDQLAEALDGNAFDHSIRKLLVDFQVPFHPTHWMEMQDRLESHFDALLRQKLVQYRSSPVRKDWVALSSMLREEGLQRTPVIAMRPWMRGAVAAAILLLFLMVGTIWQGTPQKPWFSFKQVLKEATRVVRPSDSTSREEPQLASNISSSAPSTQVSTDLAADTQPLDIHPLADLSQIDVLSQSAQDAIASPRPSVVTAALNVVAQQERESASHEAFEEAPMIMSAYREIQAIKRDYAIALAGEIQENKEASLSGKLGSRVPDLAFGVHGGFTMTKVELNGPRSDPGYSAGLRMKLKLNDKWAIVSGLQYGEKRFYYEYLSSENPESPSTGLGNRSALSSTNVKAIQGDFVLVDLPLLLRYTIPSENPLRLYVQGGMMNTISLREDYVDFDPQSAINSALPEISSVAGLEGADFARNLKTYPGNIYVSIGIEFPVAKNSYVEIEPYFLQNLQRTKEAEGLDIRKRLYTTGVSLSFMFDYQE